MGTHLDFKPHVFFEFWQSTIPTNEGKKANAKTLGSWKPNAHWCANVQHEPGTDLDCIIFDIGFSSTL